MLLTTLTCLSGSYWAGGMVLNKINQNLIKHNTIQTLGGRKKLIMPKFIQKGMMYTIHKNKDMWALDAHDGWKYMGYEPYAFGYTFIMQDGPIFDITNHKNIKFHDHNIKMLEVEDYYRFCNEKGIGHIQYCYNSLGGTHYKKIVNDKVIIDYTNELEYGDVWYLENKRREMEMIVNTNELTFKNLILRKYKVPYVWLSFFVFLFLVGPCYEYWVCKKIDI